jgi:hypothetical protein
MYYIFGIFVFLKQKVYFVNGHGFFYAEVKKMWIYTSTPPYAFMA